MTMPAIQKEALVDDGKGGKVEVRKGDKVALMPPLKGDSEEAYLFKKNYEFMLEFLDGPGPYIVSWIGRWPCGKKMLYLKLENGREPGAHASNF